MTHDKMLAMALRMRTVYIPDHIIEDLMGVKLARPVVAAPDDDTGHEIKEGDDDDDVVPIEV